MEVRARNRFQIGEHVLHSHHGVNELGLIIQISSFSPTNGVPQVNLFDELVDADDTIYRYHVRFKDKTVVLDEALLQKIH